VSADGRWRRGALAVAGSALLIAPATWSAQTLGHATNGTFPAGGPVAAAPAGGPGAGPGAGAGAVARGRPAAPGAAPGAPGAGTSPPAPTGAGRGGAPGAPAAGAGAGGPFGGTTRSLTRAVAYVGRHGGGTIAVSSQSGAASELISSGARIAALGGFSGRESSVSVAWLADAVESGQVRWVLTDAGGGLPADSRTGADDVLALAKRVGRRVGAVSGLYDLQGRAAALRAAAS
jgi:hypothetical protein